MSSDVFILRSIGARIRARREYLGLTTTQLAQRIGKTKGSVSHYEDGSDNVKAATLYSIARALGVEPAYFYGDPAPSEGEDVLHLMSRLSPRMRRTVLAMVRAAVDADAGAYDAPDAQAADKVLVTGEHDGETTRERIRRIDTDDR